LNKSCAQIYTHIIHISKSRCDILLVALFLLAAPMQVHGGEQLDNPAKNVILLIGDGMGLGQLEVARQLEYGKTGVLHMETLDHVGLMRTYSANNFVTDSAAGGSAIATGIKTNNESIAINEKGQEVDSVLDAFQTHGKKVGIISTNTVVDATPAAFGASVANRWTDAADIARQLFNHKIDVILGGGASYFMPKKQNGVNLIEKFRKAGYTVATNRNELAAASPRNNKLVGLFHPAYMNFQIDKEEYKSEEPTLQEMTMKAIDVLSRGEEGFFLMAEGARIDHMAHAADVTGIWKETIAFDQTVKAVVNWAKKRNDTLVVVLADHETMGISATEKMNIEGLKKVNVSAEYMAKQLQATKDARLAPERVIEVFSKHAHIQLTLEEAQQFIKNIESNRTMVYPQNRVNWEVGSTIAKHYNVGVVDSSIRAASSTGGHTANMIPIFATGPGSSAFNRVIDNTDVSTIITNAANIPFTPGQQLGNQ